MDMSLSQRRGGHISVWHLAEKKEENGHGQTYLSVLVCP